MADLARLIDVSRQAVSSYERGIDSPGPDVILRLSRVLTIPRDFFFADSKTDEGFEGPLFFRSQRTTLKKDRKVSYVKAEWAIRAFELISDYLEMPSDGLPCFDIEDFESLTNDEIEAYALEARRFLGLGLGPISNMTQLLENHGVPVIAIRAANKVGAFSFTAKKGRKFVLTDQSSTGVRMRFSLAHELGHLILHRKVPSDFLEDKELFDLIEDQANYFAGAFLMPAESFSREILSPSFKALSTLKPRWKVSIAAMGIRASNLGLLSENQKAYLFRQLAPYRKEEPFDNTITPEKPGFLNAALEVLEQHQVLSGVELRDRLSLPVEDLAQFFGVDEARFRSSNGKVLSFSLRQEK